MPRLSILIPYLGNRDSLENTLASVLQNRPARAEIVVALGEDYDDPYQLGEEVRFVRVEARGALVGILNRGFEACQARIVHTLACGATVSDGWADQALQRFDDCRVASVAPLAVQAEEPQRIWAAGLEYRAGGQCQRRGQGALVDSAAHLGGKLIGPSLAAGFYRRSALGDSLAFDPELGPDFADVDLALRLLDAGYAAVCEPASIVFEPHLTHSNGGWKQARQAERLFWRHASRHGWLRSAAAHLLAVASEFSQSLPRPKALTQLAGRCLAACEWGMARRRSLQFALPTFCSTTFDPSAASEGKADAGERRLDGPHATSKRATTERIRVRS